MTTGVGTLREDRYAIITGNGRSGTNWLETMLNASPVTHCRSEPYGIPTSPFNRVPQIWKSGRRALDVVIDDEWDKIICWSRSRIGEGDNALRHPKCYVHGIAHTLGLPTLMAHSASRRIVGFLQPRLRDREWPMPWWIGSQRRMQQAYAVFKVNLDQHLVAWILANRPQVQILHIVRHPCGRLNSWLNRYLPGRDPEQVLALRRDRLHKISEIAPVWRDRFGTIDSLNLVECEVWFWRYVNETVHAVGSDSIRYLRVLYEELVMDPLPNARRIYELCGLPWDSQVASLISKGLGESVWGKLSDTPMSVARAWRTKLPRELVHVVERIVWDSPIMSWWEEA